MANPALFKIWNGKSIPMKHKKYLSAISSLLRRPEQIPCDVWIAYNLPNHEIWSKPTSYTSVKPQIGYWKSNTCTSWESSTCEEIQDWQSWVWLLEEVSTQGSALASRLESPPQSYEKHLENCRSNPDTFQWSSSGQDYRYDLTATV